MAVDWAIPHWRQRGRQTTARARSIGAILAPEMASSTKLSRLPVANPVCLGSWMVDICQERHSPRSAPQRRHTAHLRWRSCGAPKKPSSQDWGGDKMHHTPGTVCSPSTWSPKLLRPGKGTKCMPNQVVPLWSTQEPELEQLRPGKCTKCRACFGQLP